MAGGACAEPQRKTAPRDERSRGAHAAPRGHQCLAGRIAGHGRVGRGSQRVKDGLVADDASATAGEPVCGGVEHARNQRPIQGGRATCHQACLDQGGAIQRARGAADCRGESVSDGA